MNSNEDLATAICFSAQAWASYVTRRWDQGSLNCDATLVTIIIMENILVLLMSQYYFDELMSH
jgi:hypothetical protein